MEIEGRAGRWVGVMIADEFEDQDEAVRQRTLWAHLLDQLAEQERIRLDYVFTMSPSEYAALDDDGEEADLDEVTGSAAGH